MKLYKYEKTVQAEPMSHKDAEVFMGVRIPNYFHGSEGYIVQDIDGTHMKWVPKSTFEDGAICIDTAEERINVAIGTLRHVRARLDEYAKSCSPVSQLKRGKIRTCRRHLELCADLIGKLMKIN